MVIGSLGIGGTENFMMNYFRCADKTSFEFDFYVFSKQRLEYYEEILSLGGNVHFAIQTKSFIGAMSAFSKFLKHRMYDVVYCQSCSINRMILAAIPAKMRKVKKVIVHSHSMGTPKGTFLDNMVRGILKWCLCLFIDYGFSCSDLAGEGKYTPKFISSDRYVLIHNAIDTSKYQYNSQLRDKLRKQYKIEDKIVVGNVGRLSKEKNQKFLLDIVKRIKEINNEVVLIIAGKGELEKELSSLSKELNIEENVILLGQINNVSDFYSAMDVFVMSSFYEGLPFTAVEAQINGLPCVFSDTITKMADISGQSEYISLKEPATKWAESIIKLSRNRLDSGIIEKIIQDYDMIFEARRIESYF